VMCRGRTHEKRPRADARGLDGSRRRCSPWACQSRSPALAPLLRA